MENKRDLTVNKSNNLQMDTIFDNSNTEFDVKEEDPFEDITIYDTQTEVVSAPKMELSICPRNNDSTSNEVVNFDVKQEDSSKRDIKLSGAADNCAYYYHCRICKEKMTDFLSVIEHRELVHNLLYKGLSVKYLELEPDIFDTKNYCRACELKFGSIGAYRKHLRSVHHMVLIPWKDLPKHLIAPDINEPRFYCSSCKKTLSNQHTYRGHLKKFHKMDLAPLTKRNRIINNTDILPEWDNPDNYCRSCELTYKTRYGFRNHCELKHNVERPEVRALVFCKITLTNRISYEDHRSFTHRKYDNLCRITDPDVLPKFSNHNNFCGLCEKTLYNKYYYQKHLRYAHKILDSTIGNANHVALKPNINDPNHYCCACNKTFSGKLAFKNHLLLIHFIRDEIKVTFEDTDRVRPDVNDPNHHCHICKKTYGSGQTYRQHLRMKHNINLQHASIKQYDPNLSPDPLDPNYFCRVCKTAQKSLSLYRRHCKVFHCMSLGPIPFTCPDAVIDVNSPTLHCARCNRNFKSKKYFRSHLRVMHRLEPIKNLVVNPNAKIDVNDPNFYCAKCDKNLATKSRFRYHVRNIHKLEFPSTRKSIR